MQVTACTGAGVQQHAVGGLSDMVRHAFSVSCPRIVSVVVYTVGFRFATRNLDLAV